MENNKSTQQIIELCFDQRKQTLLNKLISEITLKRIRNSHSPYITILKVFFAIFLAIISDTYISQNPDSVSSAFTAILCISPVVTRGIKSCISTFLMCCIGAVVSTIGNIICGVDASFIWRVPIGTSITYYLMFLCHMEDDVGGLSAGAFSAIFVQLVLYEYKPLLKYSQSEWLNTFIVRLLSVFTGCVSSFIVNSFFDIIYYKFFFKTKIRYFSNDITLYLHEFVNEPENYYLEYKYQILNDLIVDINYAIDEISFIFFKSKSMIHYASSTKELENYKKLVYAYLRLLNHLSFLGYQIEIMNDVEIESVKKVVKQCIMKLYSHQYHMKKVNFVEKVGYFVNNGNDNNASFSGKNNNKNKNKKWKNNNRNNNKIVPFTDIDFVESPNNSISININNKEDEANNSLINNEAINLNIINNEHNEENIPESLRIPLKSIISKIDIIITVLDNCKILFG